MKINGYWLGIALVFLVSYANSLFNNTLDSIISALLHIFLTVIFFGFAFEEEKKK